MRRLAGLLELGLLCCFRSRHFHALLRFGLLVNGVSTVLLRLPLAGRLAVGRYLLSLEPVLARPLETILLRGELVFVERAFAAAGAASGLASVTGPRAPRGVWDREYRKRRSAKAGRTEETPLF